MIFRKISISKVGTANVTYLDDDGNTVTVAGANIVHEDFRRAMKNLVPHLAMLVEAREAISDNLEDLNDLPNMSVVDVQIKGNEVTIRGTRLLQRGETISVVSPRIDIMDDIAEYPYRGELQLAIDNVRFEAEAYITERKWAVMQKKIEFADEEPFADVSPVEVASVEVQTA